MRFEPMSGFHKLVSLWRIEYRAMAKEPIATNALDDSTRQLAARIVGKEIRKMEPDIAPIIYEGKAAFPGNAVKGAFRHLISAQLTAAGLPVCVQKVKASEGQPKERREQCPPATPASYARGSEPSLGKAPYISTSC